MGLFYVDLALQATIKGNTCSYSFIGEVAVERIFEQKENHS